MAIPESADYLVRGFRGQTLLLETWHVGESSKNMEVSAWSERIKRGEATHIEIVSLRKYQTETIYN